jgi:hypothetical protein
MKHFAKPVSVRNINTNKQLANDIFGHFSDKKALFEEAVRL